MAGSSAGTVSIELHMAFGPPIGMKIVSSPQPLGLNWRGTAKAGHTLDELRPSRSLVWDACLNQSVSRHPSRRDGW